MCKVQGHFIDEYFIVCSKYQNCFDFYCEGLSEVYFKKLTKKNCKRNCFSNNKSNKNTQSANIFQELANSFKLMSLKFKLTVSKIFN